MYPLLAGLSIVEASSFVASPSAGLYLAQLGAEVIRVDQIGGGPDFRRWPQAPNGASLYWENLNRAKKSVALDLSHPEGRALMQALAASTGQFLTNFPADGFLAHDQISAARADLITIRIMGTAEGGPALDYTVNAAVGVPQLTGPAELGDAPVNHVLPAWDLLTGAYAAFTLLAAVQQRAVSGKGGEYRIPLQDVATGSVANLGMIAEALVTQPRPRLGNDVFGAFGRDFMTADGKRLILMAITPRQWRGLIQVLGIEAAVAQVEAERGVSFASDEGVRYVHRNALYPLVEHAVAQRSSAELLPELERHGCCFGSYQSIADTARDSSLVTSNPMFGTSENPSGAAYPAAGPFVSVPAAVRTPPRPAPLLGADTDQVLADQLGLSAAEIGRLHDQGVVASA